MAERNNKGVWGITGKYRKAHYFETGSMTPAFSICGRVVSFGMTPGKGQVGLCKHCMRERKKLEQAND